MGPIILGRAYSPLVFAVLLVQPFGLGCDIAAPLALCETVGKMVSDS